MTDIGILYSYLEEEHGHQYIYYPIEYFKTPEDPLAYNTTAKRFAQDIIHDHWENANTLTPIEHYRYCLGIIKFDDIKNDHYYLIHVNNNKLIMQQNIHHERMGWPNKQGYKQLISVDDAPKPVTFEQTPDGICYITLKNQNITYNQPTNTLKYSIDTSVNNLPCVCRRCLPEDTTYNCREEFPTQYNFLIAIPEDILNNK